MMLVANVPLFKGTQTGWINCGDPIPAPDEGYVFVPYPANSDSVLAVDANGHYTSLPKTQAGPAQYMQVSGHFLECEVNGAIVIPCVPGLK